MTQPRGTDAGEEAQELPPAISAFSSRDPRRTVALLVGIEEYAAGERYRLDGPVNDVLRVASWLQDQGVPAENLLYRLNPLEKNLAAVRAAGIAWQPADRASIWRTLLEELSKHTGDALIIYWSGHGFGNPEQGRGVFCADTKPENQQHLNLDSLLAFLRSPAITGFMQQIVIVDACADYVRRASKVHLPNGELQRPAGDRRPVQLVWFATQLGQLAINDNLQHRGVFTEAFFAELGQHSPEPALLLNPAFVERVRARIAQRGYRFTPTYYWYQGVGGATHETPLREAAPFAVPYRHPHPTFVGRVAELLELEEAFCGEETAAPVRAVTGMGGMGKTQLAIEFVHRYRARFPDGIFWISMVNPETAPSQLAEIATSVYKLSPDTLTFDERVAYVRRAWERTGRRLIVLDNLEEPPVLDEWQFAPESGTRVLITARTTLWLAHGVQTIELKTLSREHSMQLLLALPAAKQPALDSVTDLLADAEVAREADTICERLGDLPLAVELAAYYLAATCETKRASSAQAIRIVAQVLQDYLTELDAYKIEHPSLIAELARDFTLPSGHEQNILSTFALSYTKLQPEKATDALALRLLQRAALCAPAPIPAALLARSAGFDPAERKAATRLKVAFLRLKALGLLEELPKQQYRLHILLGDYVRLQIEDAVTLRAAVVAAMSKELYAINEAGYPQAGIPYLTHARHLLPSEEAPPTEQDATLLNNLAYLLDSQGDYTGARPLYERTLAIVEQVLEPSHPDTATSLNNLASLLQAQGDYAAAQPLFERALAINEQVLGPSHPDTAQSLNNLAELLYAQGDYTAARPLLERALAICEQRLGAAHPMTIMFKQNLERVLPFAQVEVGVQAEVEDALASGTRKEHAALFQKIEELARYYAEGKKPGSAYLTLAARLRAMAAPLVEEENEI